MTAELLTRPATELAALVKARRVSPVELVGAVLARIDGVDGRLNSMVTVDAEGAMRAARAAEAGLGADDLPPFHGVPTAIKDLHMTAGIRTTFATASRASFVPAHDEHNVAQLRRAGFLIVGKTNTCEFGTVPYTEPALFGAARNPWAPDHSPGGSSGGAAAAVAGGILPVAHASDGGGSIRIPASACGLVGLKPARGRISAAPMGEPPGGLGTTGTITRYVRDTAALLDVMQGYVPGDPHWAPPPAEPFALAADRDPAPLKVGLATTSSLHTFDAEAIRIAEDAAAVLEKLGHRVEPFAMPVTERLSAAFGTLWTARLTAVVRDPDTIEPYNRVMYERATQLTAHRLVEALHRAHAEARRIVTAAAAFDVVLSPTLTRPPARIGEFAERSPQEAYEAAMQYVGFTPVANVTGLPAISVPTGVSTDGLPMGAMLMGRPADEVTLLAVAGQLERAFDWISRRPPDPTT